MIKKIFSIALLASIMLNTIEGSLINNQLMIANQNQNNDDENLLEQELKEFSEFVNTEYEKFLNPTEKKYKLSRTYRKNYNILERADLFVLYDSKIPLYKSIELYLNKNKKLENQIKLAEIIIKNFSGIKKKIIQFLSPIEKESQRNLLYKIVQVSRLSTTEYEDWCTINIIIPDLNLKTKIIDQLRNNLYLDDKENKIYETIYHLNAPLTIEYKPISIKNNPLFLDYFNIIIENPSKSKELLIKNNIITKELIIQNSRLIPKEFLLTQKSFIDIKFLIEKMNQKNNIIFYEIDKILQKYGIENTKETMQLLILKKFYEEEQYGEDLYEPLGQLKYEIFN